MRSGDVGVPCRDEPRRVVVRPNWGDMRQVVRMMSPAPGLPWGRACVYGGGRRDSAAWVIRLAAYAYAIFYSALDVISGIAAGYVKPASSEPECPAPTRFALLFRIGTPLGEIGSWALIGGCAEVMCGGRAPGGGLVGCSARGWSTRTTSSPRGRDRDRAARPIQRPARRSLRSHPVSDKPHVHPVTKR